MGLLGQVVPWGVLYPLAAVCRAVAAAASLRRYLEFWWPAPLRWQLAATEACCYPGGRRSRRRTGKGYGFIEHGEIADPKILQPDLRTLSPFDASNHVPILLHLKHASIKVPTRPYKMHVT